MTKSSSIEYQLFVKTNCKSVNFNNFLSKVVDVYQVFTEPKNKYGGYSYNFILKNNDKKYLDKIKKQITDFCNDTNQKIIKKWGSSHTWYHPSSLYDNIQIKEMVLVEIKKTVSTQIKETITKL